MKKSFCRNFLIFNPKVLKKIYNCLSIAFGPNATSILIAEKTKELKSLNKGSEILTALDFTKEEDKICLKIFQYLSKKNETNSGEASISVSLFFFHLLYSCLILRTNGHNNTVLNKGLHKLSLFILNFIFEKSKPIKNSFDISNIVKSSLVGKIEKNLELFLQNSFKKIKREGFLQIEESLSTQFELEEIQGIEIEKGFSSSYFINDIKNSEILYDNALLLISDSSLTNLNQIESIIEFSKKQNLPLIIIAKSISKELLSNLILNNIKKKLKIAVIKYSSIKILKTGILEDLALLTHSNYHENFDNDATLREYKPEDLGFVGKVIIKQNKSIFFLSKFSKFLINRRLNELNRELLLAENNYEKNLYENRISRLSGNLLKIKVRENQFEKIENSKKKIEHLFLNLRASFEEGYVIGGASFYILLYKEIKHWSSFNLIGDEIYSSHILLNALKGLSIDLFRNAKTNKFIIFKNLLDLSYPYSYDLKKDYYIDGLKFGLYDSSKSLRILFTNSLSILLKVITISDD